MPKVFLSHSSEDHSFVEKLASDLNRRGINVWFDKYELKVGDSLRQKIFDEGIDKSDFVVVVFSKASLRNNWVQREMNAAFALEMRKREVCILPILLDVEYAEVPSFLADIKMANFTNNYKDGLIELISAILNKNVLNPEDVYKFEKDNVVSIVDREDMGTISTGVIIDQDGLIMACNLCRDYISEDILSVHFHNGISFNEVKIVDHLGASDISLMKINGTNLSYSHIGNSDLVKVDDQVIVLLHPDVNRKYAFRPEKIISENVGVIYEGKILEIAAGTYTYHNKGSPVYNEFGDLIGIIEHGGWATPGNKTVICPVNRLKDELRKYLDYL